MNTCIYLYCSAMNDWSGLCLKTVEVAMYPYIWLINLATHCKHATGHSPSSPQTNQWLHVASLILFTLVCTKNQEELAVNSQGNKRWKEISWQEMITSSIFLIQFGVLVRVLLAQSGVEVCRWHLGQLLPYWANRSPLPFKFFSYHLSAHLNITCG